MYTRTIDPAHIIIEVVDNACDEALGGFATQISVVAHTDGSFSVVDNGRGIPVGLHPEKKVPTVELVFCKLHAGGKFSKSTGGSAYGFSGGLHGVGVSVTNALSTRLEVEVKRERAKHKIAFEAGHVKDSLQRIGSIPASETGTTVRAWPDAQFFDSPKIKHAEFTQILKAKAVLLPGVQVSFTDEATGTTQAWCYADGLKSFLAEELPSEGYVSPIFAGERFITGEDSGFAEGEGASWAVAWSDSINGGLSFVNLIPTANGGTHVAGLRAALYESIKDFCVHHGLLPRNVTLQADDVWRNCRYVLSAKVLATQFQGQTKDTLTSRDTMRLISSRVKDPLDVWLNTNVEDGKKIAELVVKTALARSKSSKSVEKRKGSGAATLPGKLTDCNERDIGRNELFIVEGDSAGGSAKQARDREFQAVLPAKGKILNTWEVARSELFSNVEVHDVAVAIGVDPHGRDARDTVLDGLRYGKIIIMSDADVDGAHIQTLFVTLFFTHFPKIVEAGRLYIARPPLFAIKVASQGKGRPERRLFALDADERDEMLAQLEKEGVKPEAIATSRFKGLGEMNPDQLKETTMMVETRRLLQIVVTEDSIAETNKMLTLLMAKGEAAARRAWLEREGDKADLDI
jgi:topoisomerase-4 subunit B